MQTTLLRLKKVLRSSPLSEFAEKIAAGKYPSYRARALTIEEIAILERNGNSCDNWAFLQVEASFDPNRVRNSIFSGHVSLPAFYGTVMTPGGISVPTGIYRSTVQDCVIENAHIQDVSHISGVIVSQGAILQNIGSFVTSGLTTYGAGKSIPVGNELGGRTLRISSDMTFEIVEDLLLDRKDVETQQACSQLFDVWLPEIQQKVCFVGKGAMLCNTTVVRNSWIGPHARIDGAAKIRNSVIASSLEYPSEIYDGVILEGVQMQEGVRCHSFAQVRDTLLMRQSRIGRQALINASIISQACHIEEAEVTSSFVGPLTQLHHHSLLISALWPEGRGNVGYGANVGSNHTGRQPDQEILIGTGVFFGLGSSIKFPANFSEAPFSILATGVVASPQRLRFPFSLVQPPTQHHAGINNQLNEIFPGWALLHNLFGLARNQFKFNQRSKGLGKEADFSYLTTKMARLVLDSWYRLQPVKIADVYTEKEIPGLGSNFLRESVRQEAMRAYASLFERYAVDSALHILEENPELRQSTDPRDVRRLFQGDLLKESFKVFHVPDSAAALVRRHRTLEKRWLEGIIQSHTRDQERGRRIFDDYDMTHPEPVEFLDWSRNRYEEAHKRCNVLLKALRQQDHDGEN